MPNIMPFPGTALNYLHPLSLKAAVCVHPPVCMCTPVLGSKAFAGRNKETRMNAHASIPAPPAG